jgi:hypothetical protein
MSDPEYQPMRGPMYHYTSIEAFLSIIENKCLRATNVHYLNDASEGELGISLVQELAAQEQQSSTGIDGQFLKALPG